MPFGVKESPRVYVGGSRGDWRILTLPEQIQIGPSCFTRKEAEDLAFNLFGRESVETFFYNRGQPGRKPYRDLRTKDAALKAVLRSARAQRGSPT